ncbi:hypothetical protein Hanom_Chr04g00311871 [Helianthus anomalus]
MNEHEHARFLIEQTQTKKWVRLYVRARLRSVRLQAYRQVAFGGEGVAMPHSAMGFIINVLLALAEIKSQGAPGFPFRTHPQAIMVSVTGLLMYGLASAAELVGLDPTSVYAIAVYLGKLFSLCILVASLAVRLNILLIYI